MKKIIEFVSSKHKENYTNLITTFTKKIDKNLDIAFKLLTLEEVYCIAKDYINGLGINFNNLLMDCRLDNTSLFICQLAQSFYLKSFTVNSFSSTRKLDRDTRDYIIDILYSYVPLESKIY